MCVSLEPIAQALHLNVIKVFGLEKLRPIDIFRQRKGDEGVEFRVFAKGVRDQPGSGGGGAPEAVEDVEALLQNDGLGFELIGGVLDDLADRRENAVRSKGVHGR